MWCCLLRVWALASNNMGCEPNSNDHPKRLSFMQPRLQGFFFRKSFLRENPWVEITFEFISYGIEYRGTSHGTFGCLPFTKGFWEIWLEIKWKLKRLFGSFQQKISRSKGTSEKVVVAIGRNYICKIASLIPVLGLRSCFSVKGTDLYKW